MTIDAILTELIFNVDGFRTFHAPAPRGGGGGAFGYFLGGYVPSGTPNWHPVLKKFLLKLIPCSRNGPVFYTPSGAGAPDPVLQFALKLNPVLEMGQSFILCSRVQQEYNGLLVKTLNRIFKSYLSVNKKVKWLLTKLELSYVRNIIPRSRKRLWNGYPVLNKERQNHDPVGRHIPV